MEDYNKIGYVTMLLGLCICFAFLFDYIPLKKIKTDQIVHRKYIGQIYGSAYPMIETDISRKVNSPTYENAEVGKPLIIYESSIWAWLAGIIGFFVIILGAGWTQYRGSAADYY